MADKYIPWQKPTQVEYIYNIPLTLLTGFGGALIFIGSIALVVAQRAPLWVLGVGVGGLLVGILGRVYAAWHKHRNWVSIQARCVDREIREVFVPSKTGGHNAWAFRLLCTIYFQGQEYSVTPETAYLVINFNTEEAVQEYLAKTIDVSNQCTLWVNPDNPLQCSFHRRPKI